MRESSLPKGNDQGGRRLATQATVSFQDNEDIPSRTGKMALDSISSLTPDPVANVPSGRYVIITPARNEGLEIEQTIQSGLRQTGLPSQWVIGEDGSTDGTAAVIDRYAQRYAWITALHR